MKNLIIIIIFISFPLITDAQFTGSGTLSDPYSGGILRSNQTWLVSDSPIWVIGDLTIGTAIDAGHLTIEAGVNVIFCTTGADLIITGLGQLTANGTLSDKIRFTADTDKDGVRGETGETWGHISFQNMGSAGASLINYCIIEYGDVRSAGSVDNPFKYGGAIHAAFSNLTVSNCLLQNNKAKWGGALFVSKNFSPLIRNCHVLNNESDRAGGGIYFWDGSASVVENCLFEANACKEASSNNYSGGGLCAQSGTSIKVINSTFVNNTTTRLNGSGIELYTSPNARVINTILWGSGNQVQLSGTTGGTIINSAIQGSVPAGAVNCIVLNLSNSNPSGPNFVATDGTDWSISSVSPCRNAGVNSYGSPNLVPANDYAGRPRIAPFDIGAYEAYNLWIGGAAGHETEWSFGANWLPSSVPVASSDVAIPDVASDPLITSDVTIASLVTDPRGSLTVAADNLLTATTLTNGGSVILQPSAKATLSTIINTGSLKLNSGPTGTASLITDSYTRGTGGSEEIQLYLSGGGNALNDNFKWHFISTPISSLDVSTFAPGATYNVAQWIESRPTGSLFEGWVAYDGYIYPSGTMGGETFSSLTPGKGYDFYDETDNTFTFGGIFNTTDVTMNLGYSGTPSIHGFNLLGNPFSSGLDWDYIITHSYPANTSKSLYFTRDNVQCTYASGVGIPSDVNGIIPPMQGFFNKTYSTGNSIIFPATARTHDNIHNRYKGASIIPLVRLSITDNSMTDETVVRFDNEAKADLDYDFDAVKMSVASSKTYLYTLVSDIKYAINGQPFPEDTIKITVVVNVTAEGTHTISATQLQGLDKYNVSLFDKSNSISIDLKKTPQFTFTSSAGTLTDRFVLNISKIATGIEIPVYQENKLNIYHSLGFVNIQTLSDEWTGKTCIVRILDLTGKTVKDVRNLEFDNNSLLRISSSGLKGIYFVEVKAGSLRYVGKVVIRQ